MDARVSDTTAFVVSLNPAPYAPDAAVAEHVSTMNATIGAASGWPNRNARKISILAGHPVSRTSMV
jgi:hypothetical protein